MIDVDGPLPPPTFDRKLVVRVDWHQPRQVIALSEKPRAILTHWHNGRTERCTMQEGGCGQCMANNPVRWRGFILVLEPPASKPYFLDLSETAVNMLLCIFQDRDTMRGSMFKIHKTKGGLRGRFEIEACDRRLDPDKLPPSERPDELLDFLFKSKRQPRQ